MPDAAAESVPSYGSIPADAAQPVGGEAPGSDQAAVDAASRAQTAQPDTKMPQSKTFMGKTASQHLSNAAQKLGQELDK
jgi:hypothetical protein